MDNVQNSESIQHISQCLGKSGAWSVIENGRLTTVAKPGFLKQLGHFLTTGSFIHAPTTLTILGDYIVSHLNPENINSTNFALVYEIRNKLSELNKRNKLKSAIQSINTSLAAWEAQPKDLIMLKLNDWCLGGVALTREEVENFANKEESKDFSINALLAERNVDHSSIGRIARRLATEQLLNKKGTSLETLKTENRISEEDYTRLQKGHVQLLEEGVPTQRPQFTVHANFS